MFARLNKKEDRLKIQAAQFESLIKSGYTREDYNDLYIFTQDAGGGYFLKIYSGTSTNFLTYTKYSNADRRAAAVQQYKDSSDRRKARKAEEKANPRVSTAANCAAAIREELKQVFPGVKFSVKSSNFAGGNSVDVSWNDGPCTSDVDAVISKYQYGHFDGMSDMYENSNTREDIPQAKYVHAQRDMSAETRALLMPIAEQIHAQNDFGCFAPDVLLYRIFQDTTIPAGATVNGIARTDCTCGQVNDFYIITYTLPIPEAVETPAPVEVPADEVQVIEYSTNSIAVIGNTKPIKDKLKELGGRFNFRLTCGAGWIFPKNKLEALQAALS